MSKKHSSWKDNEIVLVYCHLLKRNVAVLGMTVDGLTRRWLSFPRFTLADAFKLSILYVPHTKSTRSIAQKVDITYGLRTSGV